VSLETGCAVNLEPVPRAFVDERWRPLNGLLVDG
jgi:hypothetical protein